MYMSYCGKHENIIINIFEMQLAVPLYTYIYVLYILVKTGTGKIYNLIELFHRGQNNECIFPLTYVPKKPK